AAIDDPVLAWLETHQDVRAIFGGYWDVYRLSYLTGGRVNGIPYPAFPNRFPEWSQTLPDGRPETVVIRRSALDRLYLSKALADGGRVVHRGPGFVIVSWPRAGDRRG